MSGSDNLALESDVPLFNVHARVPSGTDLEEIERRAHTEADMPTERIESLINALRDSPRLQIGTSVPMERAIKAREQLAKTGLVIEITPVLSLQAMSEREEATGPYKCRACGKEVELPENRQCPSCGIFVDKVTDKDLLKRKIMEQERQRLDLQRSRDVKESDAREIRELEARLRNEVRDELEAEMGMNQKDKGLFAGKKGLARAATLGGMLLVAFAGGLALQKTGLFGGGNSESTKSADKATKDQAASVDKMLDSIGPKDAGGGTASGEAGGAGGGASPSPGGLAAVDDVFDDPLIQASNGKKGSLSVEQAVAASMTLAKAVGNTTAERAMNGGANGPVGSPSARAVAAAKGAAGGPGATAAQPAEVPKQTKVLLSVDFARHLAELGQGRRAQEVLKNIKSSPNLASAPAAEPAIRLADLEIQAWGMHLLPEGRARKAAENLIAGSSSLSDPAERVQALSKIGVIVSKHGQLPPEASRAFLTQAADSLKSISDAQSRQAAMTAWASALGEVLVADATQRAKSGQWSKAQTAAAQLDELIKNAPDSLSQARLYASQFRMRQLLGQQDKAGQSLQAAISLATKNGDPVQAAAWLRSVLRTAGTGAFEALQPNIESFKTQTAERSGLVRAQALTQVVLIYADAGANSQADAVAQLVQGTPGLKPTDEVTVTTELLVQSDLATARFMHISGMYAEAENILQRLAGYLL